MPRTHRFTPGAEPLEGRSMLSGVAPPQLAFLHPEAIPTTAGKPAFVVGAGALPVVPVPYLLLLDSTPDDVVVSEPTYYGPLARPFLLYPESWTQQDIATWEAVEWYVAFGPADPFHSPAPPLPWPCSSADPFGMHPATPTVSHATPCAVVPLPVEDR